MPSPDVPPLAPDVPEECDAPHGARPPQAHGTAAGDALRSAASDALRTVLFEALFPDVAPPERATRGSAGYDLRAHLRGRTVRVAADGAVVTRRVGDDGVLEMAPGETALVPLGFRARLPPGTEAQLRIRSSVAFTRSLVLPNAPGTVDADYPDEWLVMLRNVGAVPATIRHGERIAQAVLARFETVTWEAGTVAATTRLGGLGSTGRE